MTIELCVALSCTNVGMYLTPTKHQACGDHFTPLSDEEAAQALVNLMERLNWEATGPAMAPRLVTPRVGHRYLGGVDVGR